MVEMGKRGWRSAEPVAVDGPIERPTTLKQIFSAHINELNYTIEELGELFGIEAPEVEAMYPIDRPKLRLAVSN